VVPKFNNFLENRSEIQFAKELTKYEMTMFKCVTMAKCGNIILIDDK